MWDPSATAHSPIGDVNLQIYQPSWGQVNTDDSIVAADMHNQVIHINIHSPLTQQALPKCIGIIFKVYIDVGVHKHPKVLGCHANTKELALGVQGPVHLVHTWTTSINWHDLCERCVCMPLFLRNKWPKPWPAAASKFKLCRRQWSGVEDWSSICFIEMHVYNMTKRIRFLHAHGI